MGHSKSGVSVQHTCISTLQLITPNQDGALIVTFPIRDRR
jgi:hypothetical protein